MKLTVIRTDGGVGPYSQSDERQSRALICRLKPDTLFCSGPVVIGVLNPFTVLNPDEICWIEASAADPLPRLADSRFEFVGVLRDRAEFEQKLASHWMSWMSMSGRNTAGLFQAMVELNFRGGRATYIEVRGRETNTPAPQEVLALPAIVAESAEGSVHYINPRAISRMRVYHSRIDPDLPDGLWFAEADEI